MTVRFGPDEGWRRLHPLSPLVRFGRGVLAVLTLVGLSASGAIGDGSVSPWYELAIAAVAAVAAVINWLVTRWKVDGVTLRIETGLLRRDSRQLPVARIQAVDLVRPFFARMLGLAELRVRLAGHNGADGRLAYLTEPAALALRARLLAAHHGLDPATPEPSEQIMVTVPAGRLIGSAMVHALGLAVVVVAAGAGLALVSPAGLVAAAGSLVWWLVLSASLVWQRVSSQYGFTVAASGDGVRIRRGLLGTVAETIPVARIQAVRMIEPLLWRPFGWRRLEVDVAGHPGHDRGEGPESGRKALLAVGGWDDARSLIRVAVGRGEPVLTRPPRRARWKAPVRYHYLAAGHNEAIAVTVTGRLRRLTTWVPLAKAQSVRFVQGPVQRRLGLATVHLDVAGRHVGAEFAERGAGEARRLAGELAALGRTARRRAALAAVPPQPPPGGEPGDGLAGGGQAASVASPVNAAHRRA